MKSHLEGYAEPDLSWLGTPQHPLADLHFHLGTSVSITKLGDIIGDRGQRIRGKVPDSRDLEDLIMVSPEEPCDMKEYFENIYHPFLDAVIGGREVVEDCTQTIFSGAYRNKIDIAELRTAPLKHNGKDGSYRLGNLLIGLTHGLDDALVKHKKLRAGLIFCLDRGWAHQGSEVRDRTGKSGFQKNQITVEKAIQFKSRGVVGIDIAGLGSPDPFPVEQYVDLFQEARAAGLGVTIHAGEHEDANDIERMLVLEPSRIGHGILAAYDPRLMGILRERGIVLEICPASNLATRAVRDVEQLVHIINTFVKNDVRFAIATDWPETIRGGRLADQYKLLARAGISTEILQRAAQNGVEAAFVKKPGIHLG